MSFVMSCVMSFVMSCVMVKISKGIGSWVFDIWKVSFIVHCRCRLACYVSEVEFSIWCMVSSCDGCGMSGTVVNLMLGFNVGTYFCGLHFFRSCFGFVGFSMPRNLCSVLFCIGKE